MIFDRFKFILNFLILNIYIYIL